jgi:hypothetical protein
MGYLVGMANCWGCGRTFTFNPERVPSIPVRNGQPAEGGTREPICEDCMTRANERRMRLGLDPHPILPGAYDPMEAE